MKNSITKDEKRRLLLNFANFINTYKGMEDMRFDYIVLDYIEEMENSMKQANDNYQKWQDRHDVEKALFEWEQNRGKYATAYNINGEICYSRAAMKSFAQDFAERVKGAPIKTTKTKKHD